LGTNGSAIVYPKWVRCKNNGKGDKLVGGLGHIDKSVRRLAEPGVRLYTYLAALGLISVWILVALLDAGYTLGNPWVVIALAGVAAVAEHASVRVSSRADIEVSISGFLILFAAVLFGPLAAMAVAAASMIGDLRNASPQPRLKWAVYTCVRSINGAIAGLVAVKVTSLTSSNLGAVVIATCAAALVYESLDLGLNVLTVKLRGTGSVGEVIRSVGPTALAAVPLTVPVVALLAFGVEQASIWILPVFFLPALAAQRLFVLYQEQMHLADELSSVNDRLEQANLSFATALVTTLDARDRYTAGHSAAVAIYARDIAARMGLPESEQQLAHVAGLVHDIGKIGLPPGLLEKPGALTLEERRLMEAHSEIGERILAKVDDYSEIAAIVRHHHERFDGNGYPDGIGTDEIPMIARIIAVADAYNAMTSDRPYREAMPTRVARLRLAQAVETQFDTSVVAAFEAILAGASETYRLATRVDFQFDGQALIAESLEAPEFTPELLAPRASIRAVGA
jgi:putative nucleotidyltransferase with HDIG domain